MLTDAAEIDELVEALEVRFLANRDAEPRSRCSPISAMRPPRPPTRTRRSSQRAIDARSTALEREVRPADGGAFFLFHRARRWNPREGVWMGWERKRGKLEELNARAARRAGAGSSTIVGPVERSPRRAT